MALERYSSRRTPLGSTVLQSKLRGAVSYDRIAGFFRSSLLEVAGEELESISGPVRILCNSDLDSDDVKTAQAAASALRREWCEGEPEKLPDAAHPRLQRLYEFLRSGKLQVKVLPDDVFGLVHGKAGVIRYADHPAICFLGSVNESRTAWTRNYELLWEDDSPESIQWVQEEFDALWHHPESVDLACCPFIVQDLKRIVERKVIPIADWKKDPTPAAVVVESPVYRKEQGLWPHQKYFAKLAMERHRLGGARLVLADQVGLGKTVQLAMAAMLMALEDSGPILVLAPKTLLRQWQGELMELLHLPSARWDAGSWIDENDVEHPTEGLAGLQSCPRRIGLVSQGIITRGREEVWNALLSQKYLCVIVDEAHRIRREKIPRIDAGADEVNAKANPKRLMEFMLQIAPRTKSLLLATATPVQLHPLEAWDLLHVLSQGNPAVLGGDTHTSPWWRAEECLSVSMNERGLPQDPRDAWSYVRDPLPPSIEDPILKKIRERLNLPDTIWRALPESYQELPVAWRRNSIEPEWLPQYGVTHNPMLRCIVRRTRSYLESTINPNTKEPYLPPVAVRLFGEGATDSLVLGTYLSEAYHEAEKFCELLAGRVTSAGFFKTLLLRRLGSSIEAGKNTLTKLLNHVSFKEEELDEDDEDMEEESDYSSANASNIFRDFTPEEKKHLRRCRDILVAGSEEDPKMERVLHFLLYGDSSSNNEPWADRGCILFSQYFDTVQWVGARLAVHPNFVDQPIGLYAGSGRSGIWRLGEFKKCARETIKEMVRDGRLRLVLGTDAASEGLNFQKLGTLIHIDLPWNPTRLEQRKGRIQRIGQTYPEVWIANLRYRGSVEDRVHELLSQRLQAIHDLFGQIPDTLKDVWVDVAIGKQEKAKNLIDSETQLRSNPFDAKYSKVDDVDWESCANVIDPAEVLALMKCGWDK